MVVDDDDDIIRDVSSPEKKHRRDWPTTTTYNIPFKRKTNYKTSKQQNKTISA